MDRKLVAKIIAGLCLDSVSAGILVNEVRLNWKKSRRKNGDLFDLDANRGKLKRARRYFLNAVAGAESLLALMVEEETK